MQRSKSPYLSHRERSNCTAIRVRGSALSRSRTPSPGATRRPLPTGEVEERRSRAASNLLRRQIFYLHAVAVLDDLGDPLPVAVAVVALVAENADRAGLVHQRRQLVEFLPGLRGFQMRRIDFVQQIEFAAARRF